MRSACSFVASILSLWAVKCAAPLPLRPATSLLGMQEHGVVRTYVRRPIFLSHICPDLLPHSSSLNGSLRYPGLPLLPAQKPSCGWSSLPTQVTARRGLLWP